MSPCACCRAPIGVRDPDPWEGRLDAYCYGCASARCDAYPGTCRPDDREDRMSDGYWLAVQDKRVQQLEAWVYRLCEAIDELKLWEPGRKGYAAALRRVFDERDWAMREVEAHATASGSPDVFDEMVDAAWNVLHNALPDGCSQTLVRAALTEAHSVALTKRRRHDDA